MEKCTRRGGQFSPNTKGLVILTAAMSTFLHGKLDGASLFYVPTLIPSEG